jgi:hypothetical protein
MKYRKKLVLVGAVQFTEAVRDAALFDKYPLPQGVLRGSTSIHPADRKVWRADFYIETLKGRMAVGLGDWIITDAKGEMSLCKDEIFKAAYEPDDDPGRPVKPHRSGGGS